MKFSSLFSHLLLASLLVACISCTGGGNGGNGGNKAANGPQSKEEALQKLSRQHKENFEAWQTKVVKSCDSSSAFGLHNENVIESVGIDGKALIGMNKGSVVFSDSKNLLILTGYHSFSGIGTSKIEESFNINGDVSTISVETKREGSLCSVFLFGQKVYETVIVESFNIGIYYSENKLAQSSSRIPIIKNLGVSGAGEVIQHGFYSLIEESLKPSKEAQTFLGQKLGLTPEESVKLFKLNNYSAVDSTVRFKEDLSSVWSNAEGGNLIAETSNLRKYFDEVSKNLELEVRLQIPQFDFRGIRNDSDNGNIKLNLTSVVSKNENEFSYLLKTIENFGLIPFDQNESELCLKGRFSAYLGDISRENSISPSTQVLFSPCRNLFPDLEKLSYQNGFLKSLLPIVFANVNPSSQFQYGGWDYVLSYFSKEALEKNKNLRTDLDPLGKTKIVSLVANHLEAIKLEIEKSKNMLTLYNVALQMGLDWTFRGINVPSARISQIILSVDNSADVFKISSEKLLNEMSKNPNANEDLLSFAQGMEPTYKIEAQKALNLSKELNYASFETDRFNQVIQKKISLDEIKIWVSHFSIIKNELIKYPALTSAKGELVESSLKWLKNGEVSPTELGILFSSLNNSVEPFVESTKQLIHDIGQSYEGNKVTLEFARNLTPEYKQLAISIRNNSLASGYESWGQSFFNSILQKSPSSEQLNQWNLLWISALDFINREKIRVEGDFGSMSEWNRKKVVEVALREVWTVQEFKFLETLAPIAKFKNTCDRHKDMSSLADCGGLNLFSKGDKKFFDPQYNGRYILLGNDFNTYMNQLSGFDWTTLRWTLLSEFFGSSEPIWSRCDNLLFKQKLITLKNQINAISIEKDQFKKWDQERQIKDTIKNCQ